MGRFDALIHQFILRLRQFLDATCVRHYSASGKKRGVASVADVLAVFQDQVPFLDLSFVYIRKFLPNGCCCMLVASWLHVKENMYLFLHCICVVIGLLPLQVLPVRIGDTVSTMYPLAVVPQMLESLGIPFDRSDWDALLEEAKRNKRKVELQPPEGPRESAASQSVASQSSDRPAVSQVSRGTSFASGAVRLPSTDGAESRSEAGSEIEALRLLREENDLLKRRLEKAESSKDAYVRLCRAQRQKLARLQKKNMIWSWQKRNTTAKKGSWQYLRPKAIAI